MPCFRNMLCWLHRLSAPAIACHGVIHCRRHQSRQDLGHHRIGFDSLRITHQRHRQSDDRPERGVLLSGDQPPHKGGIEPGELGYVVDGRLAHLLQWAIRDNADRPAKSSWIPGLGYKQHEKVLICTTDKPAAWLARWMTSITTHVAGIGDHPAISPRGNLTAAESELPERFRMVWNISNGNPFARIARLSSASTRGVARRT
jgi:hypothetical protein